MNKFANVIQDKGMLLMFPIKNEKDPDSFWPHVFPRSKFFWDWTKDTDPKIFKIRTIIDELLNNDQIIQAKWYKNRATFFSKETFQHMLAYHSE